VETAGQLLVTAGDNPDRLHSEAALAALCGASPVAASSGKTVHQANNALWVIALTRLRDDARTRAYAERRAKQGKTPKDVLRCLKRHLARELLPLLKGRPPGRFPAQLDIGASNRWWPLE
jgi:transposase